jgi:hypothetical protein
MTTVREVGTGEPGQRRERLNDVRAVRRTANRERCGARRRTGTGRHRRLAGDEGAALVEAAFITPVFLLLLFGVVEFGGAFRDYLTLSNAVGAGTRQEAIQGANIQADWLTLQSIKKAASAFPLGDINYIVVWKANGPKDTVPAACKTAGQTIGTSAAPSTGSCNRFTPSDVNSSTGPSWTCTSTDPIKYWCPTTRNVQLSSNSNTGPDYLGVYISMTHKYATGFFGRSVTLTDSSVTKLEPTSP